MDMRLLAVFDEVYKTRSVTRATENLDIPQTFVSLALARMRRQFNDLLFVRTAEGMVPTPHATDFLGPLRQAVELLRVATRQQVVFDAASSTRRFRICMTDVRKGLCRRRCYGGKQGCSELGARCSEARQACVLSLCFGGDLLRIE